MRVAEASKPSGAIGLAKRRLGKARRSHDPQTLRNAFSSRRRRTCSGCGWRKPDLRETPDKLALLGEVDVLVDGPFVLAERDTSLAFRGSRNQRVLDAPASLLAGTAVPWRPDRTDERMSATR